MKKPLTTKILAVLALLTLLGAVGWVGQAVADGKDAQTTTSTFKVEGMSCGGCELSVKMKVRKLDGVKSVEASYRAGEAKVVYDADRITPEDIVAAIEELGYTAELFEDQAES